MEVNSVEQYKLIVNREKKKIKIYRLLILLVFLLTWETLVYFNVIDSFLFSSPSRVGKTFFTLLKNGELFIHIKITLIETIVAFSLSTIIGISLGIVFWYFEKIKKIVDPYLVLLNSIPKTALAPIIIVWFGIGYTAIVAVSISIGVFATTMSYISILDELDENKVKLIYVLGGTKKDVLTKVVFPYSIPTIISISKINIGLSLIGVIIGEFLVAQQGLGYMIIYGSQIFKLDNVILSLCLLSTISYMFYSVISIIEKKFKFNRN